MGQRFGLPHSEVRESGFRAVTWPDVAETRLWRPKGGGGQTTSLSKAKMLVVFTEQVSVECRKRSSQEFLGNAAIWACVCGLVMEHEGGWSSRGCWLQELHCHSQR